MTVVKYVNDVQEVVYRGVTLATPFDMLEFQEILGGIPGNKHWEIQTDIGTLTVSERATGFGYRDTESGYVDTSGKYWLASGNIDVREAGCNTVQEAILFVKQRANTIRGV